MNIQSNFEASNNEGQDGSSTEKREGENVAPKPVTFETIKNDPSVLDKIYQALTIPKSQQALDYDKGRQITFESIDENELIDFGAGFEETNLDTVIFNVGYTTGLFRSDDSHNKEMVSSYLKLLFEDPAKAQVFLEDKLSEREESEVKTFEFLSKGFDLGTIIPGAPSEITGQTPTRKNTHLAEQQSKHVLLDMDTGYVSFVKQIPGAKEVMREIIKGKTVIDLGAGSDTRGLEVMDDFGAKNYVAVEPFNAGSLLRSIYSDMGFKMHRGEDSSYKNIEKVHISKTDLETFLSKIPEGSDDMVFFASSIDGEILGSHRRGFSDEQNDAGKEYIKKANEELKRLLVGGATLITCNSAIGVSDLVKKRLMEVDQVMSIYKV